MNLPLNRENIKIALISLPKEAEEGVRTPPIGLVYLATYLKEIEGIKNIKIIDQNYDDLYEQVKAFSPDVIGIGPMTIYYEEACELAAKIKRERNIPIVIGGVHISTLPSSLRGCFDVGVMGEGEITFAELIRLLIEKQAFIPDDLQKIAGLVFKADGKLVKTNVRKEIHLDSLPLPDYSLINQSYFEEQAISGANMIGRRGYIISSRSCPYKCKFCSTSHFWGKLRLHSPENTARLIHDVVVNYGSNYIGVMDDLFTISAKRLNAIKSELIKLGVLEKIKGIDCQPRANLMDEEMCSVMRDLKVRTVNFGFESGSERVLHWLKEGSVTVEMNKKAIILCKKYGFKVYGSLIFGSPGEKIDDLQKTIEFIDFAVKNGADWIWSFAATPYPATPFWEIAIQRGKVSESMDFNQLALFNLNDPFLLDEDVDRKQFGKLFSDGQRRLTKLKIKMVLNFFLDRPIDTLLLVAKHPLYYLKRVKKFIFRHEGVKQ